jgi:anti-sigma B factor antagonist
MGDLETRVYDGGRSRLVVARGPLAAATASDFFSEMAALIRRGCRSLVLDLRQVEFVDSHGVKALLRLRDEVIARRVPLRLVIAGESRVERTLRLLRFETLFEIHRTPSDAWRSRWRMRHKTPPTRVA